MKKTLLYILIITGLIFLFPVMLTTRFSTTETVGEPENIIEINYSSSYEYKNYGTINLINTSTNQTSQINLDEYLLRCSFSRNAS